MDSESISRIALRGWPSPCYFYDRAVALQVFVARVYGFLIESLNPGDTVIDCGANIGCFTIAASRRVGKTGCVLAVEPHPGNLRALHQNVRQFDLTNVTVVEKALFRESGSTVGILGEGSFAHLGNGGIPVPTVTLSDLVREYKIERIAAIKVDVEGSEESILDGDAARAILRKCERIQIESQGGDEGRRLQQTLHKAGFNRITLRRETAFLRTALRESLRSPKNIIDLYRGHSSDLLSRLLKSVFRTVLPSPTSEQGFNSIMICATREDSHYSQIL